MSARPFQWDWEIGSKTSDWGWSVKDLVAYRHLLVSLVKREFLLNYQQTVLGPLWVVFQPLLILLTYIVVFQKLIAVSIGSLPPVLFYFSGIILWGFFMECFERTSNTFRDHIHLFSKVYFPRIIMPLSLVSTSFLRCMIQLGLLLLFLTYFLVFRDFSPSLTPMRFAFPFAILITGMLSLGMGLIFSILTAKYRDIGNLVTVCIRLLMFVSPVFYPLSSVQSDFRWVVELNPLTPLFELFRLSLLGEGTVVPLQLVYSIVFTIVTLSIALVTFNKAGNKLIDVV